MPQFDRETPENNNGVGTKTPKYTQGNCQRSIKYCLPSSRREQENEKNVKGKLRINIIDNYYYQFSAVSNEYENKCS